MATTSVLSNLNQEVTQAAILAKLPATESGVPQSSDAFIPVSVVPERNVRVGFDKVVAGGVDTAQMTVISTGAGQTINQSGGNLVLTSGTTANSETIIRSVDSYKGELVMRFLATVSQRIVNNNFYVELVDVIGDGLAVTVNSSTSVTVTIPSNPFTAANVGQFVYLGAITVASAVPGRYAIASVSGNTVNFTVVGWPASGAGTLSLFGWNHLHTLYTGTTTTAANFDGQRNGWNSGDTVATVNTTTSGHIAVMTSTINTSVFADQLAASATALELTQRASRVRNIPDDKTTLRVQIRSANGTTAPASTTTFTVGFIAVENFSVQSVNLASITPQSMNTAIPVQTVGTVTTSLASTTISSITTGTGANNLGKNEDAAHTSADVGVFVLAVRNDNAATTTTSTNADYSQISVDGTGTLFVRVKGGTPTLTSVVSTTASTSLIAANPARRALRIYNNSTSDMWVNEAGGTASATTGASLKIAAGGLYEFPDPVPLTAITGIWTTANGTANITEAI